MATKITRTVTTTIAKALAVNPETADTTVIEVCLAGVFKDDKKLMKAVKKAAENETCAIVAIKEVNTVEDLYGMDEETFIAHAVKLPPRKKNV